MTFAIDEADLLSRLFHFLQGAAYFSICKAWHWALPLASKWGRQTGRRGRRLGSKGFSIPLKPTPLCNDIRRHDNPKKPYDSAVFSVIQRDQNGRVGWLCTFLVDDVHSRNIQSDLELRLLGKLQMIDHAVTDLDLRVPPRMPEGQRTGALDLFPLVAFLRSTL